MEYGWDRDLEFLIGMVAHKSNLPSACPTEFYSRKVSLKIFSNLHLRLPHCCCGRVALPPPHRVSTPHSRGARSTGTLGVRGRGVRDSQRRQCNELETSGGVTGKRITEEITEERDVEKENGELGKR